MDHVKTVLNSEQTLSSEPQEKLTSETGNEKRREIMLQLRRLISHFPTNRTESEWEVILDDFCNELERYDLSQIELAVSGHLRDGEFFPKLSELLKRVNRFKVCEPVTYINDQIDYQPPTTAERKAANIEAWERVKDEWAKGTLEDRAHTREMQERARHMELQEDQSWKPSDVAALVEADRKRREKGKNT